MITCDHYRRVRLASPSKAKPAGGLLTKVIGQGWFALQRMLAGFCLLYCTGALGTVFPVKLSPHNPRLLVDQRNAPFLLVGDAAHSLMANVSEADASFYLSNRARNGFNSLWVQLLCVPYCGGRTNGCLLNGIWPFTNSLSNGEFDLSTPNEAYFAHVDTIIRMAATNGIQIMLDPLDTGALVPTALDNGPAKCRAFGRYLGSRYKSFPNLVWLNGNDFQSWQNATNDEVITAIALGIKDRDPKHLQTVELNFQKSSSLDDPNWREIAGVNLAYTYYPTYAEVLHAYQQSSNAPVILGEEHYEFESVGQEVAEMGAPSVLRRQEYWAMLSGAVGQIYGNGYTWPFTNGWKEHLDSPGVAQLKLGNALFMAHDWWKLIPDAKHTFVTSGLGSYSASGKVSANFYVTAAVTEDGTCGITYLPQGGTVTINLASLSGPVTAKWYDPENGTYHAIEGSPFPNAGTRGFTSPGNNSGGDDDWVMVLSAPPARNRR